MKSIWRQQRDNCDKEEEASCWDGRIRYIYYILLMILQMRLMTQRCHLPGSRQWVLLAALSKYLLKMAAEELNAYEMIITHTPHCAAEGSAATYCRSFILLIAPVGKRHRARFIKQLDRKSAQLAARLNSRCRCVCHFYNKLWPIELSVGGKERNPRVWQFLASLDVVIVVGISCVCTLLSLSPFPLSLPYWPRATPADAELRLIAFLALNQLSSNKSASQGARL